MFFTERIKQWLRPQPIGLEAQPKEEVEVLSTKVEIGEDGSPGKFPSLREVNSIQPQNAPDFAQY